MKLHDLETNEKMLDFFKKDMKTIENNKKQFFYNGVAGKVDEENSEKFDKIKDWKLIYAVEDESAYASELAIILKSDTQYALISHYNAGRSVVTQTKVSIVSTKEELKNLFTNKFSSNGLDSSTDKRISPRFDFDSLIESLPNIGNNIKDTKPKM